MIIGGNQALAFLAGTLTTLSPCVLPILPLIVGAAVKKDRLAPLFLSLGLMATFTLVGWSLAAFGALFGWGGDELRIGGALFLALFGMVLLSEQMLSGFSRLSQPLADRAASQMNRVEGNSRGQNFAIGALLGLVWSPCSGPTLGTAVALAAQEGGGTSSFFTMLFFSLGAVTPLCAIAYGAGSLLRRHQGKILRSSRSVKRGFGLLMVTIAIAVVSGADKWVEAKIVAVSPAFILNISSKF
jgi:cytochrome c-type biogenesis protein